jgi:Fe-S oxidoreductase
MTGRDLFRFCACCPAPCRSAIPVVGARQAETATPSSLSLIALAVIEGRLSLTATTRETLQRTAEAHACVAACPYGLDVGTAIDEFVARSG